MLAACCASRDKIPVDLFRAQTPEYRGVIVADFFHQIGLDHIKTGPNVKFDDSAYSYHTRSADSQGVVIHVTRLKSTVSGEPIYAWINRYQR